MPEDCLKSFDIPAVLLHESAREVLCKIGGRIHNLEERTVFEISLMYLFVYKRLKYFGYPVWWK